MPKYCTEPGCNLALNYCRDSEMHISTDLAEWLWYPALDPRIRTRASAQTKRLGWHRNVPAGQSPVNSMHLRKCPQSFAVNSKFSKPEVPQLLQRSEGVFLVTFWVTSTRNQCMYSLLILRHLKWSWTPMNGSLNLTFWTLSQWNLFLPKAGASWCNHVSTPLSRSSQMGIA